MAMDSADPNSAEVGVRFTTDTAGVVNGIRYYRGTTSNGGTHVGSLWDASGTKVAGATFASTTGTGWQEATLTAPVAIVPGQTYTASYFAPQGHYSDTPGGLTFGVNNSPLHTIAGKDSSGISVNGTFSYSATSTFPTHSYLGTNYWVDVDFTPTGPPAQSAPRPGVTGSGPILVLTDPDNHFTDYLGIILNSEGIHEFTSTDAANLGNTVQLTSYSQVIVGDEALSDQQVALLAAWVNNGGTLVAMHPRANLDSLLGLQPAVGVLNDGYIAVDGSQAPGNGITTSTVQYHGSADEDLLTNDARAVARLYSTATSATPYAAVTYRAVGRGQDLSFAYDLDRSVVYTRQGNPAWQGQNRDASFGAVSNSRSDDQFFGNASYNPEPDYVDLTRALVPQADEQQRLLINALNMSVPLPRLNYLPNGLPAVIVMTGDGHDGVVTAVRLNEYLAQDPPNCSVANWTCYRYTAYINVGVLSAAQLMMYQSEGFEIALHVSTGCADFNPFNLDSTFFAPQLTQFMQGYPGVNPPITNRDGPRHSLRRQLLLLAGWRSDPGQLDPAASRLLHRLGHAAVLRQRGRRHHRHLSGRHRDAGRKRHHRLHGVPEPHARQRHQSRLYRYYRDQLSRRHDGRYLRGLRAEVLGRSQGTEPAGHQRRPGPAVAGRPPGEFGDQLPMERR
jgi:hypothetical protein